MRDVGFAWTGCGRKRRRKEHEGRMAAAMLAAAIGLGGLAGGGVLAEEAGDDDAPYPPSWHFSGFSIGIGGGVAHVCARGTTGGVPIKGHVTDGDGWLFLNWNLRLDDHWLVGADLEFTLGADTLGIFGPDVRVPDACFAICGGGNISLRVSYAYTDRLAAYVRAGYAGTEVADADFDGGQIAAGGEWRLTGGLALRGELAYGVFENRRFPTVDLDIRRPRRFFAGLAGLYRF